MKKKILAVVLSVALCFILSGCNIVGGKPHFDPNSKLIPIDGEEDLCYYSTTHVVYIVFEYKSNGSGYGYMSPYYSKNGKLCTYDTEKKQLVEIEKTE